VARLLRARGHEVRAPSLTGCGDRSHLLSGDVDLDTHIRDVAHVLHFDDLTDAILVGHSYGGMVITGAADGSPERVGQLVYLDAALPRSGQSLAEMNPGTIGPLRDGSMIDGVEVVLVPGPEAGRRYGVTDPAALAWMQERLTPHPWASFAQPLRLDDEERVRAIPRTNINCTETLSRRPPERQALAYDADQVFEIDTGHDLMITEPEQVADLLAGLAQ
jgi:pimeloyl-ACP methyl ester carboxylesterase